MIVSLGREVLIDPPLVPGAKDLYAIRSAA
jgi:hypothetical protein